MRQFLDASGLNRVYRNVNDRFENLDSSLRAQIYSIGDEVTMTATPTVVFIDVSTAVSFEVICKSSASVIEITDSSGNVIASGSGNNLYAATHLNPATDGDIEFAVKATIDGVDATDTVNITAVKPIYYGSGDVYTDVSETADPKTSPTGKYSVTVSNDMENIYFLIPISMPSCVLSMNGFKVPVETMDVSFGGYSYKVYESTNTYDAGSYMIEVNG